MMKKMQILSVSVSGLAALIVAAPEVSANLNKQAVFIDDGSDELSIYTHTHDSFRQTHLVSEPSPLLSQQTQSEQRDSSAPISLAVTERIKRRPFAPISLAVTDGVKLPQLASVCFITDAGNCTGAAGVGTDGDR